jgi:hypothetical protein
VTARDRVQGRLRYADGSDIRAAVIFGGPYPYRVQLRNIDMMSPPALACPELSMR